MSNKKPNSSITLKINGEDREIFCSFALLNRIVFLLGGMSGIDQINVVLLDPEIREVVLKEILAERSKGGSVTKPVDDIGDIEISLEDVQAVLDWMCEHIMDFTIGALEKSAAFQMRHQARLLKLVPPQSQPT